MSDKDFPTREDANRLSEIGMFISAYLWRHYKATFLTEEHDRTLKKTFQLIFGLVEKKEKDK